MSNALDLNEFHAFGRFMRPTIDLKRARLLQFRRGSGLVAAKLERRRGIAVPSWRVASSTEQNSIETVLTTWSRGSISERNSEDKILFRRLHWGGSREFSFIARVSLIARG
jgi:hypothetical protein